jgi:AraC-like DNA-binding protein
MGRLTLDWLHVVALLGAVQGVFLAGVLATKQRNRAANRILAAAMLSFSISLVSTVYHAAGLVDDYPHFFGAGYPQPFLFGPLIYMYAVTAADRTRRLTSRDTLHLAPFLVFLLAGLPIYLMSGPEKVAFYEGLRRGEAPVLLAIADPMKFVSGVSYSIATLLFLRRHRERVKSSYSTTERVNLTWLIWLCGSAAAIWLLAVVFQVLQGSGIAELPRSDDVISVAVAALVYAIGYRGLKQPEIFRFETAEYPIPVPAMETTTQPAAGRETESSAARYERSGLTDRQAQRLEEALLALMDRERPWQDSDLTLADLASRLHTTPHKLSEVLNTQLGVTFYDFVNGYRVREVQRRIAAGEAQRVKMLTLAMDAGFASKSTFNLVFKKFTSQTPSDYRQAAGA